MGVAKALIQRTLEQCDLVGLYKLWEIVDNVQFMVRGFIGYYHPDRTPGGRHAKRVYDSIDRINQFCENAEELIDLDAFKEQIIEIGEKWKGLQPKLKTPHQSRTLDCFVR